MNNLAQWHAEPPAILPSYEIPNERYSLRNIGGIIFNRARGAIVVWLLLFIPIIGFVSVMPKTYYAESFVLIQLRRPNLTQAVPAGPAALPPDTGAIDTEVEVLRSRALFEDVAKKLKLGDDPEFNPALRAGWVAAVTGVRPPKPADADIAKVIDTVQQRSNVRRVGLTYLVRIGFSSSSPAKAEMIANALVDSYILRQMDAKIGAISNANSELGSSLRNLQKEALEAETKLQDYKNDNNLLSVEGATMAEAEVSALNRQIAEAQAIRAEKQARVDTALTQVQQGSGGADVGAALESDTIRELRKKETEATAQLALLTTQFKPEYPEVKRTKAQLTDVQFQIQREINRILSSLNADARAATQREASLVGSRASARTQLTTNNRARVSLMALEQRADAAKKIYENYLNRASEVTVEKSLQQADATVNSRAATLPGKTSPDWRLAVTLAALFALLGAAASILLSELWNRRLRSHKDVERQIGIPLAGVLPDFASINRLRRWRNPAAPVDHLVDQPLTAFAESFRNLGVYLKLSGNSDAAKIVAVTSAVPQEGKSMTSFCLARTLAMTGSKVVLVDCDLRRRGISKLMGKEVTAGIVEVVENKVSLRDAMIRDKKSSAWILPAGKYMPVLHDLFGRKETRELITSLAKNFDYVILDAPPVLGIADARMLAVMADQVLCVVQWNSTPASTARSAVNILQQCGAKIAGAILTKVNVKQQARYGYHDGSDYFHHYRRYYITAG